MPFREAFVMLHKSFIQVIHVCHASAVVRHVQYLDLLAEKFFNSNQTSEQRKLLDTIK